MIKFVVMKKRTLLTIVVACIALLGVFALSGLDAPIKPQAQNQWLSEPFQGITAYDELMRAIDTHVVCLKNKGNRTNSGISPRKRGVRREEGGGTRITRR
jgi:hypothetical protein